MNCCKALTLASLLALPLALHAENPLYSPQSSTLRIPSIDMEAERGGYHDAVLEFIKEDLWRLKEITPASEIPGVETVRVVKTDSFPVQVFLEVEGWVGNVCNELHLEKRLDGNTFHVSIRQERSSPLMSCIAIVREFSWIVPLEVYGLPAGEYQYIVNDGIGPVEYLTGGGSVVRGVGLTGSFSLGADNLFTRTAPEFPGLINPETTQLTP